MKPDKFCEEMAASVRRAVNQIEDEANSAANKGRKVSDRVRSMREFSQKYENKRILVKLLAGGKPVCPLISLADYMLKEMIANVHSNAVFYIRVARDYDMVYDVETLQAMIAAVYGQWALLVRPGGVWDYKSAILSEFNHFVFDKESASLYPFDMWSNINYGYVGLAAEFSEEELFLGADIANQLTPLYHGKLRLGGPDDKKDTAAIKLGLPIQLAQVWQPARDIGARA